MGHDAPAPAEALPVHITDDGRIFIHVGARFVEASIDDLDRTLERLAADGGTVLYSRDDPAEEPNPVAREVMELAAEHGVGVRLLGEVPEDIEDAGL